MPDRHYEERKIIFRIEAPRTKVRGIFRARETSIVGSSLANPAASCANVLAIHVQGVEGSRTQMKGMENPLNPRILESLNPVFRTKGRAL